MKYFDLIADSLAHKLKLSPMLKEFVGQHPTLIGDFAEYIVREIVENAVSPFRSFNWSGHKSQCF